MAHPHNPFGAFAFKSASNTRLTAVPALHDPPADATQPSRRRRRPAQSLPASPAKQQQHQLAPERLPDTTAPKRTTRASTRSSSPSRAPLSSPVAPKKQRKAYASLTGPPKGLGPKLGTAPLRLILVGHNPSEHAFHTGHFYSNPSNRMWPILISTGIAPPGTTGHEADDSMPTSVGVGFIDVGSGTPGTDSSLFTSEDFARWRGAFYERLKQHVTAASESIGCKCGTCGAPVLVAFTGKRQFLELLNIDSSGQLRRGKHKVASATVQLGKQPPDMLPPGWPLPVGKTEVWVLTSTSGAAPMSNADRERPYRQLAERLAQISWPLTGVGVSCGEL